jgi:hypothetical protein
MSSQNDLLNEGNHVFRGFMSNDLEQFQASRGKYVALEAARSVIKGLTNDENSPNNISLASQTLNKEKFKNSSKSLINEVFELQNGVYTVMFSRFCTQQTCCDIHQAHSFHLCFYCVLITV